MLKKLLAILTCCMCLLSTAMAENLEALLAKAEDRKQQILENQDMLPCTGTAYYVSPEGNDKNSGKSPEKPWKTLKKVNSAALKSGDCVYFERGGLWRGQLWAQNGVGYSAYGEGEKPRLYASTENGADPSLWSLVEGTENIWVYANNIMDCGVIVFDDGKRWADRRLSDYRDKAFVYKKTHQPVDVRKLLNRDLTFFSAADSILFEGAPFRYNKMDTSDRSTKEVVGKLYLRCDAGNPGEVFESIEFAMRQNIIIPADHTIFHNLCLRYCGSHAIFGGDINYSVSLCEIGWIGGSIQYYTYDDGTPVIFGNGVESDGSYDYFCVSDCYIYQVYDAGVSNQDPSETPEVTGNGKVEVRNVVQRNVSYLRNVFEYCDMPVEIFFTLADDAGFGRHILYNCLINDNAMLYTGQGWYSQTKPYRDAAASICFHGAPNASQNFYITDNFLYLSTGKLICGNGRLEWTPVFDRNIYAQKGGYAIALWPQEGMDDLKTINMIPTAGEAAIHKVIGDQNGRAFVITK